MDRRGAHCQLMAMGEPITCSQRRAFTAARMPERDNFEKLAANPVVDEVPHPSKMEPANHIRSWDFDLRSDTRFIHQES